MRREREKQPTKPHLEEGLGHRMSSFFFAAAVFLFHVPSSACFTSEVKPSRNASSCDGRSLVPLADCKIIQLLFHFCVSGSSRSCKLLTGCRTFNDRCFLFAPPNHGCFVDDEVVCSCVVAVILGKLDHSLFKLCRIGFLQLIVFLNPEMVKCATYIFGTTEPPSKLCQVRILTPISVIAVKVRTRPQNRSIVICATGKHGG